MPYLASYVYTKAIRSRNAAAIDLYKKESQLSHLQQVSDQCNVILCCITWEGHLGVWDFVFYEVSSTGSQFLISYLLEAAL